MCQKRMEKMKGMEKMKDMPEGKPMPQGERMQNMQRMMQEKMQGMEPRQRMEFMERMPREGVEPRGAMEGPSRERMERMERMQRRGPEMPAPPIGPLDVKKRLAELDLAATVQQYGKVRHMLEETRTELTLIGMMERTEGQEKEVALLSKRIMLLEILALELREKAEACCEMDGKKDQVEQPGAHDHGDKHRDGEKQDQPEKPEEEKSGAEPHQ